MNLKSVFITNSHTYRLILSSASLHIIN